MKLGTIGVAVLGAALAATVQATEHGSTRGDMRTAPNMGPGIMTRGGPMMGMMRPYISNHP